MFIKTPVTCCFLIACVCTAVAEEPSFTKSAILRKFDADKDGRLNKAERTAIRDAFGSVDVPMLPARAFRYAEPALPSHIDESKLAELDNTPSANPTTDAGATLGRVLFYDRQLSKNNTISCASCHDQRRGFSDPRQFSRGFEGGYTMRNSMAVANLRYSNLQGRHAGFFWDERAATLEAQALMPIQDKVEMGMELAELETKLQALPYYPPLFEAAFGARKVTRDGVSKAIAQFMRAMVSFDSRFDRAAAAAGKSNYAADFADFTDEENRGKSLFIEGVSGVAEIGCAHCHMPPTFNMPKAFNIGLNFYYVDQGLGWRDVPSNDPFTPNNDGKFKAPSLRNVALTAPYMHDGRFKTLERVIDHYSEGVHPHKNVALAFEDADVAPGRTAGFKLTNEQKVALVAFLKTLTDESFVTDQRFSDPFVRVESN